MKYLDLYNKNEEKLICFMNMVLEENKVMNLTAITDHDEFIDKHFYDSLLPTEEIDFAHKRIVDIGSGAGFPGIPLAICFPNSKFILIEPIKKRCTFLEKVKNQLQLNNVTILNKRAEDILEFERNSFDIALTRAVSQLSILLELCLPYLKVGGIYVSYKGLKYQEEIDGAQNALSVLNGAILKIQKGILPLTNEERFNIMIKKTKDSGKKFPRDFSQIKKKPL